MNMTYKIRQIEGDTLTPMCLLIRKIKSKKDHHQNFIYL
ncbi:hypothetical protein JEOSCH030_01777 [Phocicoccus schoeneichii]|uniref:Uncharacterized protein n=1 Tax=Phocicoccus schoeneichii TaxID=1812261 RepID=A0A6V7RPG6_9BACL|nr:hypothetical protein JEOSCH030_01777 [Jeotgalicoccus schoeneichii]